MPARNADVPLTERLATRDPEGFRRSRTVPIFARAAIGVAAMALVFAVAVPHQHDDATASHPVPSCRICKMQEGFSATPAASLSSPDLPVPVARRLVSLREVPRLIAVVRLAYSRAPPVLS